MEQDIIARLQEGVAETIAEILAVAQEDTTDKVGAQQFLAEAKYHSLAFEEYIQELLKAFGCSAMSLDYDDQQSREKILDLERQHANFSWSKNILLQEFSLSDINPSLNTNPQGSLLAQERLRHWIV